MAQQTATTMVDVLKEGWSSERLQGQFEDKNLPLGKLESYRGTVMGRQVNTPILAGRAGAFTSVGAGGGNLNDAVPQPVTKAFWTMPYNWFQIALDTSALIQSGQDVQGIVAGKDLEIKGAVENTRHQISAHDRDQRGRHRRRVRHHRLRGHRQAHQRGDRRRVLRLLRADTRVAASRLPGADRDDRRRRLADHRPRGRTRASGRSPAAAGSSRSTRHRPRRRSRCRRRSPRRRGRTSATSRTPTRRRRRTRRSTGSGS